MSKIPPKLSDQGITRATFSIDFNRRKESLGYGVPLLPNGGTRIEVEPEEPLSPYASYLLEKLEEARLNYCRRHDLDPSKGLDVLTLRYRSQEG